MTDEVPFTVAVRRSQCLVDAVEAVSDPDDVLAGGEQLMATIAGADRVRLKRAFDQEADLEPGEVTEAEALVLWNRMVDWAMSPEGRRCWERILGFDESDQRALADADHRVDGADDADHRLTTSGTSTRFLRVAAARLDRAGKRRPMVLTTGVSPTRLVH